MKIIKQIVFLIITVLLYSYSTPVFSQQTEPEKDLYLLIGQSNMAGRGTLDGKSITDDNILVLDENKKWVVAKDPLHFDKSQAAVGPALSFALEMRKHNPKKTIGLIPCAVGGTSISKWQPNIMDSTTMARPYDDAVERAKIAMKSGKLKGILWHQGEGDSNEKAHPYYEERFEALLLNLSKDLGFDPEKMPVVIGEIGIFFTTRQPTNKGDEINKVLNKIAKKHKNIECVKSKGLKDNGDTIHFDAPSARILGKRYAKAFIKASNIAVRRREASRGLIFSSIE